MRKHAGSRLTLAFAAVVLAAAAVAGPGAPDAASSAVEAVVLYDAGRFDEARRVLEGIDAAGQADGPLLYRLFFCRKATGDAAGAAQALERARAALESANATARSLEIPFYLANTYANLGRRQDAQDTARRAIEKLAAGTIPPPKRPIERFQLGKLHQDLGQLDRAAAEFEAALAGFETSPGAYPANIRWARRFLGDRAFQSADYARAEREFAALAATGSASATDYALLGASRARLGRFPEAATAWRESVRLDPANADDPRYAARVAEMAAEIPALPAVAPSGKPWTQLSREDLEGVLSASAKRIQEARQAAIDSQAQGSSDEAARNLFETIAAETRATFAAAAIEYACRLLPIRETAFREGYAVLIFQTAPWTWPKPAPDQK